MSVLTCWCGKGHKLLIIQHSSAFIFSLSLGVLQNGINVTWRPSAAWSLTASWRTILISMAVRATWRRSSWHRVSTTEASLNTGHIFEALCYCPFSQLTSIEKLDARGRRFYSYKVVALGAGRSSCRKWLCFDGAMVHDCQATVIARRALLRYHLWPVWLPAISPLDDVLFLFFYSFIYLFS